METVIYPSLSFPVESSTLVLTSNRGGYAHEREHNDTPALSQEEMGGVWRTHWVWAKWTAKRDARRAAAATKPGTDAFQLAKVAGEDHIS